MRKYLSSKLNVKSLSSVSTGISDSGPSAKLLAAAAVLLSLFSGWNISIEVVTGELAQGLHPDDRCQHFLHWR